MSRITINNPPMRWLFSGFGFHNSEATMSALMSEKFKNEVAVKAFREISPTFSRVFAVYADWSKEAMDAFADYYDLTFRKAGTILYAVPGRLPYITDEDNIDVYGFGLLGGSIKEAYINNCHIDANVNIYGGGSDIGLFLGYCADYFIFEDCTLNGSLNLSYGSYVGGFIGCSYCDMTETYFKNCQADISISIDSDDYYIGGFVGYIEDKAVFENCQTIVDINMPKGYVVGGFAGIIDEDQVFINCSAEGKIIASEFIGGMVGISECCGYNSFINCVSIVDVSGIDIMGGFIGTMYDGEYFANCYSAGEINYLGTVELDQLLENEVYIGSFYGGMYYYGENHFINCFTGENEYLGAGSKPEYEEDFIFIDFSDDNQVNNLADKLNEYAGSNEELVIWKGRNEKNGPKLFFGIVGDINGDESVDMFDYMAVKSMYITEEYDSEEEYFLADINADGYLDMFDYLQVKTIYFNEK